MSRRVQLEYGDGSMEVELPNSAVMVDSGPHPGDPDPLADPVQATADAIDAPLGMPPLGDLVGPGSTVVIAFPDRVKGGTHETAHRHVTIPLLIDRLTAAGVAERDISLVCAIACTARTPATSSASTWGARSSTGFRRSASSTTTPRTRMASSRSVPPHTAMWWK